MANPAELDLRFSQPCRHCAHLLHGRVKFCPYCGSEADSPPWRDEAANAAFGPGRAAPDHDEPAASLAEEAPAMPRPEVQDKTELPAVIEARSDAADDADLDIAHIVPAAFEWPDEVPATITPEPAVPSPRRRPILKYAAIAAVVVASVLALVLGYVRSTQQDEADRSRALAAQLAQAQSALGRGDLVAAERELAVLAATHPDHPGVRQLSDALDQRVREQLARQEQLREATAKASRSLGIGAAAPSVPAKATPAVEAPAAAAPAPAIPAQQPAKSECNEALAALSLCATEATPGAGSGR